MEIAVVRYGEIGLKSDRVRRRMERALMRNIEAQTGGKAVKRAARILVIGGKFDRLSKVFGVVSWSPAVETEADIEKIATIAVEMVEGKEGTFKVETQRVTKDFPMTSLEISKDVGALIVERTRKKVDVRDPDIVVGVEIIGKRAYVFTERFRGPGGLPVGVEGDAVLLFSGGIDSPVAGWLMGKRGLRIFPYHLEMGVDVKGVLNRLAEWFPGGLDLVVDRVNVGKIKEILEKRRRTSYFYLVMKAVMLRRAEKYAEDIGADALITGEALGQVSSQTLKNLRALERVVNIPILRPLIGFDKEEIVGLAKRIGTYEESIKIVEPCSRIRYKPVTAASPDLLMELVEEVEG